MNKNDIKLLIIVISLVIVFFLILNMFKKEGNMAEVYYENEKILTVDLNVDKEYKVKGYLGDIIIEVNSNKIRVKKETSPKHLCSLQGYTNTSTNPIICLPNKVIIKVVDNNDMDGVVY